MTEYIEIRVTRTALPAGKAGTSRRESFDSFTKRFPDMAALKAWIKDHYGSCSRESMWVDTKKGKREKAGWIFKWVEKGAVQGDVNRKGQPNTYYMQDWVRVSRIMATNPFKRGRK